MIVGFCEISILWMVGALIFQQMAQGIETVWWKEFIGTVLWPVTGLYILYHIIREKICQ